MKQYSPIKVLLFTVIFLALVSFGIAQNAIIVVIDGARYSETFAAESTYIPYIWTTLKPQGTIWTNFWGEGKTKTNPGHSTILTGVWETVDNNGLQRPSNPTVFEYYRRVTNEPQSKCAVIVGKEKLNILTHSTSKEYGKKYSASFYVGKDDVEVFNLTIKVLKKERPSIVIVNFPDVDITGHSGNWKAYVKALSTVDSLVYELWKFIQTDEHYKKTTTMIVTNDHGRHDDAHGGFEDHGCNCEGCTHILLLALGKGIPKDKVISTKRTQIDIAPTVANLLRFSMPTAKGTSLLSDLKKKESDCCSKNKKECEGCSSEKKESSASRSKSGCCN